MGAPALVLQTFNAYFFISIEYLIPSFSGDTKFPADRCHGFAIQQSGYKFNAFIHQVTLIPGHLSSPKCLIM
jgi:hypothetical protein